MNPTNIPTDEEWMRIFHTVNGQPLAKGEAELDASVDRTQSIMKRFQRGRAQQKADGSTLYAAVIGVQNSLGSFGALDGGDSKISQDFERSRQFADKWHKMATSPETKKLVEQTVANFDRRCHPDIPRLFVGDDPQPLEPIGCSAKDFVKADIQIRKAEAPSTSVKVVGATLRTVNTLATPFVYAGHVIGESVVWGAKEVGGSVVVLTKAACETDTLSTTCVATSGFAKESGRTLVVLAKQGRNSEALKPTCDYIAESAGQVVHTVKHLEKQGVPVTESLESVISVAAFVWPAAKLMRANAAKGTIETVAANTGIEAASATANVATNTAVGTRVNKDLIALAAEGRKASSHQWKQFNSQGKVVRQGNGPFEPNKLAPSSMIKSSPKNVSPKPAGPATATNSVAQKALPQTLNETLASSSPEYHGVVRTIFGEQLGFQKEAEVAAEKAGKQLKKEYYKALKQELSQATVLLAKQARPAGFSKTFGTFMAESESAPLRTPLRGEMPYMVTMSNDGIFLLSKGVEGFGDTWQHLMRAPPNYPWRDLIRSYLSNVFEVASDRKLASTWVLYDPKKTPFISYLKELKSCTIAETRFVQQETEQWVAAKVIRNSGSVHH